MAPKGGTACSKNCVGFANSMQVSSVVVVSKERQCAAIQKVLQSLDWGASPPGASREVVELELRKGLASAQWHAVGDKTPYSVLRASGMAYGTFACGLCHGELGVSPEDAETIYAVHGEWTNRTKLVWQYLSGRQAQVLVLGRPFGGLSLRALRGALEKEIDTGGLKLIRPVHLGCLTEIRAWRYECDYFLALLQQATALTKLAPDTRQLSAIFYRLLLGRSHERWLSEMTFTAQNCIFGHTGVADSGRLDWALRSRGVRTKHWLHGVSHGQNFFAFSDVAICRSEFDVKLTKSLGGYRHAIHVPLATPPLQTQGEGWLIMSNWLHPENVSFREYGIRDESLLLDQVAEAAARCGVSADLIVWKPHPVFSTLSSEVQSGIRDKVVACGFREWEAGLPIALAAKYEILISTVSTTIFDILKLGKVPLLHTLQPFDEVIYANSIPEPMRFANADDLVRCVQSMKNEVWQKSMFDETWAALGPGDEVKNVEEI